ncbi:MAG: glycosyltransferase [Acidobacteria bacterium]|nr:glycosyltransferase [Acidobacteriota bacterium]
MEALLNKTVVEPSLTQAAASTRRRLRVLHLLNSFELGGTERQAIELLKRLDQTRFDVRLAALQRQGPLYDEVATRYPRLLEFPLNSLYNAQALRQMRRLRAWLLEEQIDILHAHDFYAGWLGTLAAQFTGVKIIACQRHLRLSDRWVHAAGRRVINRLAHRVVVNAELIRKHVLETGTARADKLIVIRNGLIYQAEPAARNAVRAALLAELQLPADVLLIGNVANLRPVKGHRYLLQAAATVVRQFPHAHFLLIGKGELQVALQAQAAALGISANVHFLGQRSNAAQLAQAFDLAVLASLHEGLPNTVMEAMAAGVPVVATAVGGVLEMITDGETGYLAPAADAAHLAEKILQALADEAGRAQRAAHGQAFVLDQFSMQRMVAATEQLYDEVCGNPHTAN